MDVDSSCTSTSMYLSFDAESTVSSAMFKTLEASTLSTMEQGDSANDGQDVHNTTLEANDDESNFQPEHLMPNMSPLRPMVHNKLLQQYKALCSTPSKEQLARGVDTSKRSAMEQCIALDMPLLEDIEEESSRSEMHAVAMTEETKENVQPESGEGSSLSMSSSVEVVATTVIEKKIAALSISDEENAPNTFVSATPKIDNDNLKQNGITLLETNAVLSSNGFNKQRNSILAPKNVRKSICEPDLKSNRPSRIMANNKKRLSLAASFNVPMPKTAVDKESEIPTLINQMLKIVDATPSGEVNQTAAVVTQKSDIGETLVSVSSCRTSKLPTKAVNLGEKRPYSVSQRMSILVKTTLNSPARKMARRSLLANPQSLRRSILPKRFDGTESTAANGPSTRKSMLPVSRLTTGNSKELHISQNNRKSLHLQKFKSLPKQTDKTGSSFAPKTSKLEPTYNCTVCETKFSLKSLLDAHKRSHEDGTPVFVRKPSVPVQATTANNGNEKKCKFCDKKFALVRALHIHLLQNCAKIPPNEKRKLQYTELNHVEKAQLPPVFHGGPPQTSSYTTHSTQQPQVAHTLKKSQSNLSSAPASSAESLIDKEKDITVLANELVAAVDGVLTKMQPPQYGSIKKKPTTKTAHAGVYRTPSKAVPCHLCKKTFKNVLEYTNHSMTMHSVHNDVDQQ